MPSPSEEYYTRSVTELADIVPVTTSSDVYSTTGIKLVNKGVRLDSSYFARLGRHNILPPLEQCLQVDNGVDNDGIVSRARALCASDAPYARMLAELPDAELVYEVLHAVKLGNPLIFLLTLARERRASLYTHSVAVAMISIYLGARLSLTREKLIELASAGLFHDVGELRIDHKLLQADAQPSPAQRELIYSHPATSQRMLLNASIYSLEIVNTVMRHHENIDGSGYPFGLRGSEMGAAAKILSLAEVAASRLEQEALDGIARLEILLKFNRQKYDPQLLAYLAVLYVHEAVNTDDMMAERMVDLLQMHNQIHNIGLAFVFWKHLLGDEQIRARSPSSYIHLRLSSLAQATREVGINTLDKTSIIDSLLEDKKSLEELEQINKETLQQIKEVVYEVQRRWPAFTSDPTPVGKIVCVWMECMQGLLLQQQ
ncbi:MAG: HD-GYP domain-containing protein [Gallionellaceae bacterium]